MQWRVDKQKQTDLHCLTVSTFIPLLLSHPPSPLHTLSLSPSLTLSIFLYHSAFVRLLHFSVQKSGNITRSVNASFIFPFWQRPGLELLHFNLGRQCWHTNTHKRCNSHSLSFNDTCMGWEWERMRMRVVCRGSWYCFEQILFSVRVTSLKAWRCFSEKVKNSKSTAKFRWKVELRFPRKK